jgi:pSer/pThr/pTyr-binding forkhead associated (FHA) protein
MINDFNLILTRADATIQVLKLNLQKYIIGRHSSCDICLTANFISRFHCTLILHQSSADYGYTLWDGIPLRNASTRGTFLNGRRIDKPTLLRTGDIITFANNQDIPSIQFVIEQPSSHEETTGSELDEAES